MSFWACLTHLGKYGLLHLGKQTPDLLRTHSAPPPTPGYNSIVCDGSGFVYLFCFIVFLSWGQDLILQFRLASPCHRVHYVTQASLKFIAILLSQLPECWDSMHVSLCPCYSSVI